MHTHIFMCCELSATASTREVLQFEVVGVERMLCQYVILQGFLESLTRRGLLSPILAFRVLGRRDIAA